MSRRIKPDRRTIADRSTPIEIIQFVDYSGVPEELVARALRVRDFLWRAGWRLNDEMYRYDDNREGMSLDLCFLGEELDGVLREFRLIPSDTMD